MTANAYKPPKHDGHNFHCPHCNVLAYQRWVSTNITNLDVAVCENCDEYSIWHDEKMIYPLVSTVPLPNEDMPQDVKEIYQEASNIESFSPRATAALLRVALEKLTDHLGEKQGNLNKRIGNLQKKGLPQKVIQSLDIVRITANEGGAHAGQIDLGGEDNKDIVSKLFQLVNFVVEKTISDQKQIKEMFSDLPEDKKQGIKNRDQN